MLFKNYLTISISVILLSFTIITACSDNGTTGVDDEDEQGAVINGSVENGASQEKSMNAETEVEGTTVWAARITSEGSFEAISDTETEADASGDFSLTVDANTANQIAIIAEHGGQELKGFISAQIENGQSYTLKPINAESSAETEVFALVVAEGKADVVHKSDIETAISANSGAEIHSSSTAIEEVAAAVKNSADARGGFFAEFESDVDAKLNQYFETMTDVQFEYESAVSSSASSDERGAALDAFADAKVNAYTEADFDVATVAKYLHMQTKVMQNSMSSASASVRNDVRANTSLLAAIAVDEAVRTRAEASGMSESTISVIAEAGSALRAGVSGSSGAEAEISAAFETYHEEVRSAMENDSAVEASIIIAIDTEINAAGGAKLLFESDLSGLLNVQSLNEVYADFTTSVRNTVETQSELIGEADAEVLADILILINLF
jgi:hypothetical protein